MKISNYTILIVIFALLSLPAYSQAGKDRKYKGFYKSLNKENSNARVVTSKTQDPDIIIETITIGQLDSVMKNMVGVRDIIQGGQSLLHPVVTLELDPYSTPSQALFGCEETLDRNPYVGKALPEPKKPGIPTKKLMAQADTKPETVTPAVTAKPTTPVVATTPVTGVAKPAANAVAKPAAKTTTSTPATSSPAFRKFNDAEWKLLRHEKVTLVDETERAFLKKYAVVTGTFNTQNSAEFVKRTFNGLGEKTIVVKTNNGLYYTLLAGSDNDVAAIEKLEAFSKKYTEGQSRARRISRYGVPLDDLWVLINE